MNFSGLRLKAVSASGMVALQHCDGVRHPTGHCVIALHVTVIPPEIFVFSMLCCNSSGHRMLQTQFNNSVFFLMIALPLSTSHIFQF
jgi:hypothetical protein